MDIFIFAKIGQGNSLAGKYLRGESEVDFPALPIYFDCIYGNEDDFLKDGGAKEQGKLFFECGYNNDRKFIVVLHESEAYFLKPCGRVLFKESAVRENTKGYVKLLPVKILKRVKISDVPIILASIGANRYYSSGTFRQINTIGNIRAIQSILQEPIAIPPNPNFSHAIECLCSVQFETLVAKIFEEAGLFVPAYRGGTMRDADLFVHNLSTVAISVGCLSIGAGERKSIQIKLKGSDTPPVGIDYLVVSSESNSLNVLGAEWLVYALSISPITQGWLKASLSWLPTNFVKKTCDQFSIENEITWQ